MLLVTTLNTMMAHNRLRFTICLLALDHAKNMHSGTLAKKMAKKKHTHTAISGPVNAGAHLRISLFMIIQSSSFELMHYRAFENACFGS